MTELVLISEGAAETESIGGCIAEFLRPGDTLDLTGNLGSGKTCFVRGLVSAVSEVQGDMVSSPTYAIMNEYIGELSVYHLDCYRLKTAEDAIELGFDELFSGTGITIVEWPDRISPLLPVARLSVSFENLGENSRRIVLKSSSQRFNEILENIAEHCQKNLVSNAAI